jgi:HK97 family phage portal protein
MSIDYYEVSAILHVSANTHIRRTLMFNWLSTLVNRPFRRGLRPAPHLQAVAVHNDYRWPSLTEIESKSRLYQQSPWVYVAVNRIAEAAALVPLKVYRVTGEQRMEVERHPLENLLDNPNPYLSRFELMEQTIGMLELTGNAYWFLAGDENGVPTEIWPLRPDRVTIVPDPLNHVRGYLYEIDGQRIPLDAIEVVHFKRWHPADDYYGLSALEAARLAVQSDRAMAEWNRNTFGKDNGVPAGIVNIKNNVTDADYERIKREWRATYGGPQRRTAFLRGNDVEWKNIGLSHQDLDFLKGREAHRDEILNIFGLPIGLVSENATEANAKVAERMFIERTLWPKLVRLAQKITQELLPFWPGEHLAEFEDIRPTDVQTRLAEIRTAQAVLSINEIRQRFYHLPPVVWGDLPVDMVKNAVGTRHDVSAPPENHDVGATQNDTASSAAAAAAATPQPPAAAKSDDALAELMRWERFALKRWGRAHARAFEVRTLPDDLAFEVSAGLLAADSPDDARTVFTSARQMLTTHAVA